MTIAIIQMGGIIVISILIILIYLQMLFGDKLMNKKPTPSPVIDTKIPSRILTFEECETIINYIIDDVYKNKYYLHYRLRDVQVIPDLEDEISNITKEVMGSFSPELLKSIYLYYSEEYFITSVTRRVQLLLINYTNTHKPLSK